MKILRTMINNFFNIFLNCVNFHLELLFLSFKKVKIIKKKKQVMLRNLVGPFQCRLFRGSDFMQVQEVFIEILI